MSFVTKGGMVIRRRTRRATQITNLRRDVNILKKNIDLDFFDSQIDDAVVAATGSIQQCFTIPDGDAQSTKSGLKVTIKSIRIRYQLLLPSTVTVADATDVFRVLLVKDKQCNGALPAVNAVLSGTDIQNQKNIENSGRFTILNDRTVSINSMGGFGGDTTVACLPARKSWQYFKKMNLPIIYNNTATTGAVGTINSNNLYLLFISESGKVDIRTNVRVRYVDG